MRKRKKQEKRRRAQFLNAASFEKLSLFLAHFSV